MNTNIPAEAHRIEIRVYYEDTDFSGNVYHAQYLKFFERGRTEFLRDRGVHHHELSKKGLHFAVTRMEIFFDAAAHIDEVLTVETRLGEASGARVALSQSIRRGEAVISRAEVTVAMINQRGRAARIPGEVRAALGG
ncbi:MAG TPA: tol-pal system-associated acyl-CoA thioesterase [Devosiaceae bacterium]|nr:tol-pal system-associated acyl-CoA thioesterase [Devosiaceae bacterium]